MSYSPRSLARTRGRSPIPHPAGGYYIYDPAARCCHPCTADGEPLVPVRPRRDPRRAPSAAQGRAPTSSIESSSTGAVPSNTGTLPSNAGTLPSNAGTLPSNAGTLPSNVGTLPSNAGTLPSNAGTLPSNAGTLPSNAGTGPSNAGTGLSNAGTGPSNAGTGPSNAGTGLSNAGTGPSNAGTGPSNAGTGSPNAGTGPSNAGTGPSNAGTLSSNAGTLSSNAGTLSSNAGTLPSNAGTLPSNAGTGPSNAGTGPSNAGTGPSNVETGPSNAGTLQFNAGTLMQMTDSEDQGQNTGPDSDGTVATASRPTGTSERRKVSQVVPVDQSCSVSSYYRSTAMEFDPFPVHFTRRHSSDEIPSRSATVSASNTELTSRPVDDSRRASLPETITRPADEDRRVSLPATVSRLVEENMIAIHTSETPVLPSRALVSTPETPVLPSRAPVSTPETPVSRNRIPISTPVTPPSRIYTPDTPPPRVPNPERSERRRMTFISSGSPSRRVRDNSTSCLPLPREVTRLMGEGRRRRASSSERASRPDDCNKTIVSERASRPAEACDRTIVSVPKTALRSVDCNRKSERASRSDAGNRTTVSTPETVTRSTDSEVVIVFASETVSRPVDGDSTMLSAPETVTRPVNSDGISVSTTETLSQAVLAVHTPETVRRTEQYGTVIANDESTLSTLRTISQTVERRLARTISESPEFQELRQQASESLREKENTLIMMQVHEMRAKELEGEVERLKKEKIEIQQQRAHKAIEVERLRKDKSQTIGQYFELLHVVKEQGDNKMWHLERQLSRCKELFEQESKCAICFGGIRHALTLVCGHSFCKKCFLDWKASRNAQNCSCPICRTPVKVYSPNRMLDTILIGMSKIFYQPDRLE